MIAPDRISDSPNANPFPPLGTHVVVHATRSGESLNPNEMAGTLNWFKRTDAAVSAHWVIGRDGEKVRVIPDELQAWHAGQHNGVAFGIELCQGVEADGFTPAQMRALVAVSRGYVEDFGIQPIHTQSMGFSGFIGHEETPQGIVAGKSDPGNLFNWELFINMLTGDAVERVVRRFVGRHHTLVSYAHWSDGVLEEMKTSAHRMDLAEVFSVPAQVIRVAEDAADSLGIPAT